VSPEPIEVVEALRGRGPVALLDGASDDDGLGRWSYVGGLPLGAIFSWGDRIAFVDAGGRWVWRRGDPLVALEATVRALPVGPRGDDPRPFRGGAIGWLSYEIGRVIERLPAPDDDRRQIPDMAFWLYPDVLAHDRRDGRWYGGSADLRAALARTRVIERPPEPQRRSIEADFERARYVAAVAEIIDRIRAGDVYQVNLSQRFHGRLTEDPFALYRRLRARRPAPLGAYLEAGNRAVLSNSPELFLGVTAGEVETRPIKGTRPRGASPASDQALAAELEASAKDIAELTMIVDLMRNDLGRVAEPGTVTVPDRKRRVTLPTVHHLVATVRARLMAGVGTADLLRATLPGGSVTGCPKVRAMQMIAELEPCRRGVYTGAIGWIGADGDVGLNVAIRTMQVARGRFSFNAGGGVVADSSPEAEYDETLAKGRAFFEALGAGVA